MSRSTHRSRHALPGLVVPAQLDYAIRGLLSLALSDTDYTKLEVMASEHRLSPKFLAQVLVVLRNAGLVETHRGSIGGYRLARDPAEIRLVDVFASLSPDGAPVGERAGSRAEALTADAWDRIGTVIGVGLGAITVADLARVTEPA